MMSYVNTRLRNQEDGGSTYIRMVLIWPVSSVSAAEIAYRCSDGTALRANFGAPARVGAVSIQWTGDGRLCLHKFSRPMAEGTSLVGWSSGSKKRRRH